jgi:hypothetical protein
LFTGVQVRAVCRAVYTFTSERYDGVVLPSRDTALEVEKALFDSYRRMGPQRRLAIAFELSDNMRDIAFDAHRSSNPGLSTQELQLTFLQSVLGWTLPQQPDSVTVPRER